MAGILSQTRRAMPLAHLKDLHPRHSMRAHDDRPIWQRADRFRSAMRKGLADEIHTRPDPLIGQRVYGINLQAPASSIAARWVDEWQGAAKAVLSTETVFFTPLRSLHITIFPIIWVRGTYPSDPRSIWRRASSRAVAAMAAIANSTSGFALQAKVVRATEDAIILECDTPVELKGLRKNLAVSFAETGLGCRTPQITHLTLARFTRAVPLTAIRSAILNLELPRFECAIDRMTLSRELVYPSLQTRMLRTFDLTDNQAVMEGVAR